MLQRAELRRRTLALALGLAARLGATVKSNPKPTSQVLFTGFRRCCSGSELRRHELELALGLAARLGLALNSNPRFSPTTQLTGPCHRFSEVLQRAELRRHALGLALGLAARLAAAAACLGTAEEEAAGALARSPLLPPLLVLLQWLVHQPEMAGCASSAITKPQAEVAALMGCKGCRPSQLAQCIEGAACAG